MPQFSDNQKLYAMYLLGSWESSCTWDSTSFDAVWSAGDAKSIGLMHWTYSSAVRLCATMQERAAAQWAMLPQSWRDIAVSGGDFETADFGYSAIDQWCASVRDNYDLARQHQTWYWVDSDEPESFAEHVRGLESDLGPMPDASATTIKNMIFYMRLRHNMGGYVAEVFNGAGGWAASLESVRDMALYEYSLFRDYDIYGQGWANATNDIYDQLSGWDGESAPPDFGQILGYDRSPSAGSGGGPAQAQGEGTAATHPETPDLTGSRERYIIQRGDNLILYTTEGRMQFYKTPGGVWIPRKKAASVSASGNIPVAAPGKDPADPTPPTPPETPPGVGLPGADKMLEWCRANQGAWWYKQGTDCTLETGGPCDCSGFVSRMLWGFAPEIWERIGGGSFQFSTSQLWGACADIVVRPTGDPPDLREGDLFFENNQAYANEVVSWYDGGFGHVLMFLGGEWWDVTSDWDGRPSSGGPYVMNDWNTLVTNPNWWTVDYPFWCVSRLPY